MQAEQPAQAEQLAQKIARSETALRDLRNASGVVSIDEQRRSLILSGRAEVIRGRNKVIPKHDRRLVTPQTINS